MAWIKDWVQFSGAPAVGDHLLGTDVSDTSMAAEGTHKNLDAKWLVVSVDGLRTMFNGGGTINLGGHTFTISDGGSLDLNDFTLLIGGDLTTDGAMTVVGAALTIGGQTLTVSNGTLALGGFTLSLTGNSTFNLNDNTFSLTGGNLSVAAPVAGATVTLLSDGTLDLNANALTLNSDAVLNINGNTITSDGDVTFSGTSITVGGTTIDLAALPTFTPGLDQHLAVWDASGDLVQSTVLQPPTNLLTLQTDVPAILRMITGARLDMNDQTLTMSSPATLNLSSLTLSISGNNFTVTGGGTLDLGNNTLTLPNGGTLDLTDFTLTVAGGDVTLTGPGSLDLGGFTLTAAKTGTIATVADVAAVSTSFWVPIWMEDASWTLGSTYTNVGHARWLGTEWGAQSVKFWVGWRTTGSGTSKFRVTTGASVPYEKIHSTGSTGTYHETFWWVDAPATDELISIAFSETSNTIYPYYCMFQVTI